MFGDRLKLARKKAGHSLRSLSEALGGKVSAQAIGKYERGEMMPASDVLTAMAKELSVPISFLLSEQVEKLEDVEFRKNSSASAAERAQVEAIVIDHVERYLEIEEILNLESAEWHAPFRPKLLNAEDESEELANCVRKAWQLGSDPIPNMTELLEEKGIKVLILDLPKSFSGVTCLVHRAGKKRPVPVIVISKHVSLERRRFTLAHELAHRLIDSGSPVDHERASDRFAGAFLVPASHLTAEIGKTRKKMSYDELLQLKKMYRVSAAAMLMRLFQIGVLSKSAVDYAFQTFAKPWRFKEPAPLENPDSPGSKEQAKRFERLCLRALSERFISLSKGIELLRIPVKELEEKLKGPAIAA
jgi:Zn-dependent peptidase ImmA (M78 family)/DNA-binding XRE family transcriptional regulator